MRRGGVLLRPEPVESHDRLHRHADGDPDRAVLPGPDAIRRCESAIALVHSRYSTNTFPTWDLAHPFRYLAHNGEINTAARQPELDARARGHDALGALRRRPAEALSDHARGRVATRRSSTTCSSSWCSTGRELPEAILMMIPEAWENHAEMDPDRRAYYEYHSFLMEPWDGPASIAFTDGRKIGAVLDRNGLRPSRYIVTKDGLVVMASEVGVLDIAPERRAAQGAAPAGPHLLRRPRSRAASSRTRRSRPATSRGIPIASGSRRNRVLLDDLPRAEAPAEHRTNPELRFTLQQAFGYTQRGSQVPDRADGRATASGRSARWARTRRWPASRIARACSTTTSSSSSRR